MPPAATRRSTRNRRRRAVPERPPGSTTLEGGAELAGLEHLPVGIFETDALGACRFVNARWCEYAGCSPAEAFGTGWAVAIHPDDRERVIDAWRTSVLEGNESQIEYRFQRPDGKTTWVGLRSAPLRGTGGAITGYIGTVTDHTQAMEIRQQLLSERRYVDTVLDTLGSLVCVLDPAGRILRFNRACEVLTGYEFEDIRGRPFYDFLLPKDQIETVRRALDQVRPGEPPAASENHWLTRDGALRLISWLDTCFFDDTGALTHIVSTGLDITDERKVEETVRGIEAIGTLQAASGTAPDIATSLLSVIAQHTGYRYLALYLWDEAGLGLAAERGYGALPARLARGAGIIGRVSRTGEAVLVPDVRLDPDYVQANPEVVSEIVASLSAEGLPLGLLSIASTVDAPLTAVDLHLARKVGERLSVTLLVGREQRSLSDRARLFSALNGFARMANSILEEEPLIHALVGAAAEVVPADAIALTLLDRATGRYHIRAVSGPDIDPAAVGGEVTPGEGATGRAIAGRVMIVDRLERAGYSAAVQAHVARDSLAILAIPLMHDEVVLGAVLVGRATDRDPGFTELEREVLTLLGTQAALALANAHLLTEVRELAIRDPLTGLYNRRHFDAALEHILARWRRAQGDSQPVAAIMFDLDRFGQFNKDHGHQAGDAVLHGFAGILQTRFRAADLVARYGGEEFVAILEGATRDQAVAVAEEIRRNLASSTIGGPDGSELHATVSAGCAQIDATDPTREALLRTADVALVMAKRNGRNQVVAA